MVRVALAVAMLAAGVRAGDVAVCPGEGARYGDFKCNHDPTHRVCATLLGSDGQPENWGPRGNFWQITGQTAFQWDAMMRSPPNPGDSWCICMWATAELINAVGCDNVHLNCDATDVPYVLSQYQDGGQALSPAHACLERKCPERVAAASALLATPSGGSEAHVSAAAWLPGVCALAAVAAAVLGARRALRPRQTPPVDYVVLA